MQTDEKLTLATEYIEKAFKSQMEGEIEDAITDYKTSIEIFPTAKGFTYLGWAYSLIGRFEEAIAECKKAINVDSDYSSPYYDIGIYLINLTRLDEAIIWLERAIDIVDYEPKYLPHFNLGKIYEKKGDWFKALAYFKKALMQYPEYEPAQNALIKITTLLN